MDSLPVELLRLIFAYCDPESVRQLRLSSPVLADVGLDYLISPGFTALPWRDDIGRLRAIASHRRLRATIESITFNLTEVDAENARHTSYYQTCNRPQAEQTIQLDQAWSAFREYEHLRSQLPAMASRDPVKVAAALRPLSGLQHICITFTQCPYDIPIVREAMGPPSNWKMDHAQACKALDVLIQALNMAVEESEHQKQRDSMGPPRPLPAPPPSGAGWTTPGSASGSAPGSAPGSVRGSRPPSQADLDLLLLLETKPPGHGAAGVSPPPTPPPRPRLTSFSIDRIPLEVFRTPCDRRIWFQASENVFANLTHMNLTLDWTNVHFPTSMFRAVNGLGYVLRRAPRLTHLSLAFYHYSVARNKFMLLLRELLSENAGGGMDDSPLVDDHGYGHGYGHGFGYGHSHHSHHVNHGGHSGSSYRSSSPQPQHHAHRSSGGSSSGSGSSGGGGSPGIFTFSALTDFSLKGVVCEEHDLRTFLLRHADTLERIRLGGRGRSLHSSDSSFSGIRLSHGSFRSLFHSLRGGRLPHLKRLHLEGDFDCLMETLSHPPANPLANNHANGQTNLENGNGADTSSHGGQATEGTNQANHGIAATQTIQTATTLSGDHVTTNHNTHVIHTAHNTANHVNHNAHTHPHGTTLTHFESYLFRATTDDDWSPATDERAGPQHQRSIDSLAFEQYVLGNLDEYPGRIFDR